MFTTKKRAIFNYADCVVSTSLCAFFRLTSHYSEKGEAEPFQAVKVGDGFTEEELTEALDPLTRKWNPEREYDQMTIGQLVPGPKAVTFMGRIVNFRTVFGHSQKGR